MFARITIYIGKHSLTIKPVFYFSVVNVDNSLRLGIKDAMLGFGM